MNKENQDGFTNFGDLSELDPAVDTLISQGDRRQVEARLPKSERSRKKKERERAQARKPHRINLDLPVDMKKRLFILAEREGVPVSQLVSFLLFEPLQMLEEKAISLWGYKLPSGCPKYLSTLDLEQKAKDVSWKT